MATMSTEPAAVVPPTTGVVTATDVDPPHDGRPWPWWQRAGFRFFFVYWVLEISPWDWLRFVPGFPAVARPLDQGMEWLVRWCNANLWHVSEVLSTVPNGSGDTAFGWAFQWTIALLAAVGAVIWSAVDWKRPHYDRGLYWLRTFVRYWLATVALSYGIIKLFALQMPFPTLSNLATPIGDLLPMRLSWFFIGYSFEYQFFSGAMETIAGLLLLWRRTILAGLFAATGAFLNVVMINLAYDVPVKIFAANLLAGSLFLLALDSKRLLNLFLLHRPVPPSLAWNPNWPKQWMRWLAIATKVYMLWFFLWTPFKNGRARFIALKNPPPQGPFRVGVYDVTQFRVNGKELPASQADTLRWKDVIFDSNAGGSANTMDAMFWTRYRRGYFRYRPDTATKTVSVWRTSFVPRDSIFAFVARYEVPDTTRIVWHAKIRNDSVRVEMARVPRHFQLTERQFHWLSEYNR